MGGFFGVVTGDDCVNDLFFGTDHQSHLGTMRGGLAVRNKDGIKRIIHDITNTQFRSKFDSDIATLSGTAGIGVISDYEDQPIMVTSHLGRYAIVTVGVVQNANEIVASAFRKKSAHFAEISHGNVNPTEVVATLINQEDSFTAGRESAQNHIEGSCSILLLTAEGVHCARDRLGRTPIIIGRREGGYSATSETSAFPNLDYEIEKDLGPGGIVLMTADGLEQKKAPGERMQMCSFLWVYYGYPSSTYENINVEDARNRCGAALARRDKHEVDIAAGIPDSGTAHAIGYAIERGIPYRRPFVKYTPTWRPERRSRRLKEPKTTRQRRSMPTLPATSTRRWWNASGSVSS